MLPDRVSNPGPLTYESGALPTALRGPAENLDKNKRQEVCFFLLKSFKYIKFYNNPHVDETSNNTSL